ncbi:MAG: HD domain-containing protein [Lachnospiraceae bacterium]|nr:HD domain-containing protein [Lachnospiraceae bacterium]
MKIKDRRKKSYEIRREMIKHGRDILNSKNFLSSAKNIQHGDVSVMKHSLKVAYASMWLNRKLKIQCSERELVRGALLHDYFLYDWHDTKRENYQFLHGFYHPGIALKNATRDFNLTDKEKDIISKHMWPMTLKFPKCREAWVVTAADKYISVLESLRLHNRPKYVKVRSR